MIFRELEPNEVEEFREYARLNDPSNLAHWEFHHPVCREVWEGRGIHPPAESVGVGVGE